MDESSEITDGLFVVVERDDGMSKWIEWEHLYDCTDYDALRFWLSRSS